MIIMALDLASTSGWAVGEPGSTPAHGSHRFASAGASHESIFAAAIKWTSDQITHYAPSLIVWEAPLATSMKRGTTNVNTTTLLYGLPAVVGAVAYLRGVYDVRKADTKSVRMHFLGENPKRARAKPLLMHQCRVMGWEVEDDNEADALATWHYMCSLIEPKLALRPTPLFGRGTSR
jgi:crossover junction endodeoxyribonuclease RuvC